MLVYPPFTIDLIIFSADIDLHWRFASEVSVVGAAWRARNGTSGPDIGRRLMMIAINTNIDGWLIVVWPVLSSMFAVSPIPADFLPALPA